MTWFKNADEFKSTCGHEVNETWYPRVTKILDIKSKPALHGFYFEMGKEVNALSDVEEITSKSAEEGSAMHEVIQKTAVGEPVDIPIEIAPVVSSFEEFKEKRGIEFHQEYIERSVWSPLHRYAGTVDALCTIDGKFGVLDIKTSAAIYPDYCLQTAAYFQALQEYEIKRTLALTRPVETRWILRIDQMRKCEKCGASLREKGGRKKIRLARKSAASCEEDKHEWNGLEGEIELKEFPYFYKDVKAFLAAKELWQWENNYWLRNIGYLK